MIKRFLIILFFFSLILHSVEFDYISHFQQKTKEYYKEAVEVRRLLHRIPELCFKEKKTSAFVTRYLKKLGLEIRTGIAGTGLKAILKGNSHKPVIGIRADMDALPIRETTGLEFQSQNLGIMHACGHDAHMTNVLITAKILAGIRDRIPGTIVFIFQPCEEGTPDGSPSGASRMVKKGILNHPKIDVMLGLHVMPGYPAGTVLLRAGPIMANVASVFITIKGKSSHGAQPHQGIDAIYAASLAVMQFQALISRVRDPNERAVLSIGKIAGGTRLNIIADRVDMEGTVRTFSATAEEKIARGMEKILKGLSQSTGISYEYKFKKAAKYVKNDQGLTDLITPLFKKLLGESQVKITEPVTIGEDFSTYSHLIPSLFFFLGAGENMSLHHPQFSVDENIFYYGPLLFSAAAVKILQSHN